MFRDGKLSFALLVLMAVLLAPAAARAQGEGKQAPPAPDLSRQVEQLNTKIGELETLVEQQQRVLAEMRKRLDGGEEKALPAAAATPSGAAAGGQPTVLTASLDAAQSPARGQAAAPAQKGAQAKEQGKPAPLLAGWDDNHAFLRNTDGSFFTYLAGYAQLDYRGYQKGNHPPNTFLVRRVRLALEGKIARYYDFKVEGDFADTTSTLLRDFYLRIRRRDDIQLTAGQFKEPFSQEELRSDAFQDFVERSLVNNLSPSRSPGVMVSGVLRKGVFEYQLGAFNGKGVLANNVNGTPEGVVRLRLSPWKNTKEFWLNGLSFGGAYAQGRSTAGLSVRGQTESRSYTFFTPNVINGASIRANGELTWLLGPAAVRVEYGQTNQARNGLGARGTNLPGVVAKGYTGQFTYLLTRERKPDSGAVAPRRNLFGDAENSTGFGAWELKFRYANLQISDGTAKSNRAETFYTGANWYLNRFVRYVLDFGVERFSDPARSPRPGDRNFFVVLSRVQIAF